MEHIDVRLEIILKTIIEDLGGKASRTTSEVVRDLAWVGLGVQKEGGIYIKGPFDISRPLAELSLGDEKRKMAFWLEEDLINELKREFKDPTRRALRKAIRLGILALKPEAAKIRGPFGFERPLMSTTIFELKDERSIEAYDRLRLSILLE